MAPDNFSGHHFFGVITRPFQRSDFSLIPPYVPFLVFPSLHRFSPAFLSFLSTRELLHLFGQHIRHAGFKTPHFLPRIRRRSG